MDIDGTRIAGRYLKFTMKSITKFSKTQYEIIEQISQAVADLGGNSGLIANIMSWGDTLPDEDVLQNLKDWNSKKFAIAKKQPLHQ